MSEDNGSSSPPERPQTTFEKFVYAYYGIFDKPVTAIKEKFVDPIQADREPKYYHRNLRRVPNIDECQVEDAVCFYEANEQFRRDRIIDTEILNILRQRRLECEVFYGPDAYPDKCAKAKEDYVNNETNWFVKYGDLGAKGNVRDAYFKQKHRMVWERRYGPVGTGMTQQAES